MLTDVTFDLPVELDRKYEKSSTIRNNIMRIEDLYQFITEQPVWPTWAEEINKDEEIRAIGSTLGIEGAVLTEKEISQAFIKADTKETLTKMEAESINSREARRFILQWAKDNPKGVIDESLIRQIHTLTTRDIDYVANEPGEYRNFEATIGYPRRKTILKTKSQIANKMKEFIDWLSGDHAGQPTEEPFIRAVMSHYYITEIHPFGDGNGRVARAVEALILYKYGGMNEYCFYGLPNYCYRERNRYIAELGKIYQTGNATDFVYFCSKGFIEILLFLRNRIGERLSKLVYMDFVHQLRREKKITKRHAQFLDFLVEKGVIGLRELLDTPLFRPRISELTKRRYVKTLSAKNLIRVVKPDNKDTLIFPKIDILRQIRFKIK